MKPINHMGERYRVAGPHLTAPSPQRTPLLIQAGWSGRGREFAAKQAELIFISYMVRPDGSGKPLTAGDVRRRFASVTRGTDLILVGTPAQVADRIQGHAEVIQACFTEPFCVPMASVLQVEFVALFGGVLALFNLKCVRLAYGSASTRSFCRCHVCR